jgi:hypothetical protein
VVIARSETQEVAKTRGNDLILKVVSCLVTVGTIVLCGLFVVKNTLSIAAAWFLSSCQDQGGGIPSLFDVMSLTGAPRAIETLKQVVVMRFMLTTTKQAGRVLVSGCCL